MLGIPKLDEECAADVYEAVYNLLIDWDIDEDIFAVCADTTNVNTGHIAGAIKLLEQCLGRDLLYLACRHHILELALRAAFEAKFGKTTSPDVSLFKGLKGAWNTFDKLKFQSGLEMKKVKLALQAKEIDELINFCFEQLKLNHSRADHKELLELTILFLGGNFSTKFRMPGAMSHARWLSKAIYSLKMCLFRSQYKLSKIDSNKLEVICIFIVKFYVKAFMLCENAIRAPYDDLNLLKSVHDFRKIDDEISSAVEKKLFAHLWYLSDENVAFAFFDPNVPVESKRRMVDRLLNNDDDDSMKTKKLNCRMIDTERFMKSDISCFVTKHTADFFNRFGLSIKFMDLDPSEWTASAEFIENVNKIKDMKVVNDCAERGVKLISDFHRSITGKEEEKQFLLQVVSKNRKELPNSPKKLSRTSKMN